MLPCMIRRTWISLSTHNFLARVFHSTERNASETLTNKRDFGTSSSGNILNIPWLSSRSCKSSSPEQCHRINSLLREEFMTTSPRRQELFRERKQRRVLKIMQGQRFGQLIKTYGKRMGGEISLDIFRKLGRETGIREYTAMIEVCVNKAIATADEEGSLKQLRTAFGVFERMREQGIVPDMFSFKPLVSYVANKGMVEEFYCLFEQMEEGNVDFSETAYFEMVLWIKVGSRDAVLELCNGVSKRGREQMSTLAGACNLFSDA